MEYFLSAAIAVICALLGYATLDIDIFCRIKILHGKSETDCEGKSIGRRSVLALAVIIAAASFAAALRILLKVHDQINVSKMLIALVCIVGSACVDYREHRIPNLFPAILALGGLVLLAAGYFTKQPGAQAYMVSSVAAAVGCALFLTVATLLTGHGIGAGDIKLLSALGLMCGVNTICSTLLFGIMLCALAAIVLLVLKKKTLKEALPLGPFLLVGFVISMLISSY